MSWSLRLLLEGAPLSVTLRRGRNISIPACLIANSVPQDIDTEIARLKMNAMGVKIDKLTPEQKKYLASWEMGT